MTMPLPVAPAQAAMRHWLVPASFTIAQFGDESGWGEHMPPRSNNPFGIKARLNRAGVAIDPFVRSGTEEQDKLGRVIHITAPFRVFPSLEAAFDYHGELIATAEVYAPAMAALPDLDRFIELVAEHYATAHGYAESILRIIDGPKQLRQYDQLGAAA